MRSTAGIAYSCGPAEINPASTRGLMRHCRRREIVGGGSLSCLNRSPSVNSLGSIAVGVLPLVLARQVRKRPVNSDKAKR